MQKLQEGLKGIRRALCRLWGHEFDRGSLVFDQAGVRIECPVCGSLSPGWPARTGPAPKRTCPRLSADPIEFVMVVDDQATPAIERLIDQFLHATADLPADADWRTDRRIH